MSKRPLGIAICLLVFGIGLTAHAQDDPTPTLDPIAADAVSTLLAQTQQAPAQLNITQTVQAALEQALTATARASTPVPVDAASVEVVSITDIDLLAGPARTGAYLAPDGERFVYRNGDSLCLYVQDAAEPHCTELPPPMSALDSESIRWSPDSRTITFHENFFQLFVDADVWVWDTTTDAISNLTDDGDYRIEISAPIWKNIDLLGDWLPDGRLMFLRYSRVNGETQPPDVYAIDADGSNLEKLGTLVSPDPFAIYSLDATATGLLYNYFAAGGSPGDGIWSSALDGSGAVQIAPIDIETLIVFNVSGSPDGRYALLNTPSRDFSDFRAEASTMRLVDLQSGDVQLIDPQRYVVAAGWSPDGSALAYLVSDRQNEADNGLYITNTPVEAGRLLLPGYFNSATSLQRQPLTWGRNNTILLSRLPETGIVLVQLGS